VRVGSTNRRADAEMLQELRRAARGETCDEQPLPDLDSEAIDFRAASRPWIPSPLWRETGEYPNVEVTTGSHPSPPESVACPPRSRRAVRGRP
jgi:hypothetical protein